MCSPNDVFLWKAVTGVALNAAPNVLLIFNTCQCLLIISHIFGKMYYMLPNMELSFFVLH